VTGLLLWPELYEGAPCRIEVETVDAGRMGQTRIARGSGTSAIVTGLDAEEFYRRIARTMEFYRN
jgi:hypothetical protein